ncbi:MAG: IS630 family transposase [Defluviitaleaceae bacterium]|nr:IS630 family transposase [Defluviitaleaceae bacterium]
MALRVKKTKRYAENCPVKRAKFIEIISSYPQDKIYYIDECGIDAYIYREYAYAPRGVKVIGKISGKKFKRTNIVAAKCGSGIVAPMIYDGTTDSALFEHWFENALLKSAPKGSCFVLDNASFHRKPKLRELTKAADCYIEFLPPYSPDLNKIENYWFWIKQRLRKTLPLFDSFMDALMDCF